MAYFQVHALAGIAFQGMGSLPLALWSHIPLDDMNVGASRWYHGLGTRWRRPLFIALEVALTLPLLYFLYLQPRYILGVVLATLPDFEHPVRWLLHKKGYWLHTLFFPAWARREPGFLLWMAVIALGLGALFRGGWP